MFSAADFGASPTRIHKGRVDLLRRGELRRFRRDSAAVNRLPQAHPQQPNQRYCLQRPVDSAMEEAVAIESLQSQCQNDDQPIDQEAV